MAICGGIYATLKTARNDLISNQGGAQSQQDSDSEILDSVLILFSIQHFVDSSLSSVDCFVLEFDLANMDRQAPVLRRP